MCKTSYQELYEALKEFATPSRQEKALRYFKTEEGGYAEGDCFLGATVPEVRALAKLIKKPEEKLLRELLRSPWHELRLLALFLLVEEIRGLSRIREPLEKEQKELHWIAFYLEHLRYINNWDLVDQSAYKVLGVLLEGRDRSVLYELAAREHLWSQRVAIISTYAFIKKGDLEDTFKLSELLLNIKHDLMHKAVGWMLREAGKRDLDRLRSFLDKYALSMPRTMLRYAIEKLDEDERKYYMNLGKES